MAARLHSSRELRSTELRHPCALSQRMMGNDIVLAVRRRRILVFLASVGLVAHNSTHEQGSHAA